MTQIYRRMLHDCKFTRNLTTVKWIHIQHIRFKFKKIDINKKSDFFIFKKSWFLSTLGIIVNNFWMNILAYRSLYKISHYLSETVNAELLCLTWPLSKCKWAALKFMNFDCSCFHSVLTIESLNLKCILSSMIHSDLCIAN